MNAEMTEHGDEGRRGWVCFDAHCPWCRRWAERARPWLARRGYALLPLQSPLAVSLLKVPPEELLREMRVVETSGAVFGGADALIHLASAGRLTRHIARPARIPVVRALLRVLYRHIAQRRPCDGGRCELPQAS